MKFPRRDFSLIRTAVLLLMTAVVVSVASVAGSLYLKTRMHQNKLDDQKRLIETRTKLDRVREEERQIRRYHAKYQELIKQEVVGNENRLSLLESIARIKTERKLFEFSYQIAAQQPVQPDAALPQGELNLYASPMKFGLAVLHEEDWLDTLNDIKKKNAGVSLLRECKISRNSSSANNVPGSKLKAECLMIWFSLRPKNQAVQLKKS